VLDIPQEEQVDWESQSRELPSASPAHESGELTAVFQPEPVDPQSPEQQLLRLISANRPTTSQTYTEAWNVFLSSHDQHRLASPLLLFLSTSDSADDLGHALKAFYVIHYDHKSKNDYDAAVRVSIKLRNYALGRKINSEAVARGLNDDCSQLLLAHCIEHELWRNAASVWQMSYRAGGAYSRDGPHAYAFENKSWPIFDNMPNLATKLLELGRALKNKPLVYAKERVVLTNMASRLLFRAVMNTRIMGAITESGLLRVTNVWYELYVLNPNHFTQALKTLLDMARSRNRSQLAITIYRSLRYRYPEHEIPPVVYGMLLSICAQARSPRARLTYLLREFGTMHGKPDKAAYQIAMTTLARQGDVQGVQTFFERFCRDHGTPKQTAYVTPLLYARAILGDVSGTEAVFEQLSEHGLAPDTYCWNIRLYARSRSSQPETAFGLFEKMKAEGVRPDAYTFGTLMGLCANLGDTEGVHKLVELARNSGIPGTYPMIDTLVHSYCLNDEVESAEQLAEAATHMHLKGSPVRVWNILLRHYAFRADSDAVLRIQQRMREVGVVPDGMTYAALMTALVVIGKTRNAVEILRSLDLDQTVDPTPFHYSIVLHGFAQEGNRDMANVIFCEMLDRFPRISLSARLAMLHVQSKRDYVKTLSMPRGRLVHTVLKQGRATEFLGEMLLETSKQDLATKEPQPGLGRRRVQRAIPFVYMDFLIRSLASDGQIGAAEALLRRYESLRQSSYLDLNKGNEVIDLLTAQMIVAIQKQQWTVVQRTWDQILTRATQDALSFSERPERRKTEDTKAAADLETTDGGSAPGKAPSLTSPVPRRATNLETVEANSESSFTSMLAAPAGVRSPLDKLNLRILPSQRFILSIPLTNYMRALDAQGRYDAMVDLVQKLQQVGFALTSKNWNTYIQVLTRSPSSGHQLLAFETFEHKLYPNTPPWRLLRRGKWLERIPGATLRAGYAQKNEPVPRKMVEKLRPELPVPTYFTMVYLGTALMKFHRLANKGDQSKLTQARERAPGTLRRVQHMPYLRDRVQGILLRGRQVKGDLVKRPRRAPIPDRSGLRGSKSPLDHISVDELQNIEEAIAPRHDIRPSSEGGDCTKPDQADTWTHDINLAEKFEGQIIRSPTYRDSQGRYEEEAEVSRRISAEERRRVRLVDRIRQDIQHPRVMNDAYFGAPDPSGSPRPEISRQRTGRSQATSLAPGSLYDPYDRRLEERAEREEATIQSQASRLFPKSYIVTKTTTLRTPTPAPMPAAKAGNVEEEPTYALKRRAITKPETRFKAHVWTDTSILTRVVHKREKKAFEASRARRQWKISLRNEAKKIAAQEAREARKRAKKMATGWRSEGQRGAQDGGGRGSGDTENGLMGFTPFANLREQGMHRADQQKLELGYKNR